jgi:hypothetical protein
MKKTSLNKLLEEAIKSWTNEIKQLELDTEWFVEHSNGHKSSKELIKQRQKLIDDCEYYLEHNP